MTTIAFRRSHRALHALAIALLTLSALGCSETDGGVDESAQNTCARAPKLIQHLDDGPMPTACLGDTVMVGLRADAGEGEVEIPFYVPGSLHVTFCIDTVQGLVAALQLKDSRGQDRLSAAHGACAGSDLEPGTHVLKLSHALRGQPDAPAALLFIHTPPVEPGDGSAAGQLLSTTVVVKDSCPFCDLTNIDLSGLQFSCTDSSIQSSLSTKGTPESIGAGSCTIFYPTATYHGGNNFSGAQFGGASFNGSFFSQVCSRAASADQRQRREPELQHHRLPPQRPLLRSLPLVHRAQLQPQDPQPQLHLVRSVRRVSRRRRGADCE